MRARGSQLLLTACDTLTLVSHSHRAACISALPNPLPAPGCNTQACVCHCAAPALTPPPVQEAGAGAGDARAGSRGCPRELGQRPQRRRGGPPGPGDPHGPPLHGHR